MAINKVVFDNNTLIDLTSDTVTPSSLGYGVTAHAADGTSIVGNAYTSALGQLASKDSVNWGEITGTLSNQTDLSTALNGKQDTLTFDNAPTENSDNPVKSSGIKTALDNKVNKSGDTMSGTLNTSGSFVAKSNIDPNNYSPYLMSGVTSNGFYIKDVNDITMASINVNQSMGNNYTLRLAVTRLVNHMDSTNSLWLGVGENGEKSLQLDRGLWVKTLFPETDEEGSAVRLAAFSSNYLNTGYIGLPLSVANGGTGASTALANTMFAGPSSGSETAPSFRALVSDDIPNLNASKITSGTLPVARGGTGYGDSGEKTITNSSVFSGTLRYRRIGQMLYIWNSGAIKLVTELTGNSVTLCTLPEAYRGGETVKGNAVVANSMIPVTATYYNSGNISVYRGKQDAITTSNNIYISIMVLLTS